MNETFNVLFLGRANCPLSQLMSKRIEKLSGKFVGLLSPDNPPRDLPPIVHSWRGDLILSFRSKFILPREVIDHAGLAAVNFHPGPPAYPGSGPVNWALYEGASTFGVTAHLMEVPVDSGPILKVARFPIAPLEDCVSLLSKTHQALFDLADDVASELLARGSDSLARLLSQSSHEKWSGQTRTLKDLNELQKVDLESCSEYELRERIRCFHTLQFPLYTTILGQRFILDNAP